MTLTLTIDVHERPADRLRIRKGETVTITAWDGSVKTYRVTKVSMPDSLGRCSVTVEPA